MSQFKNLTALSFFLFFSFASIGSVAKAQGSCRSLFLQLELKSYKTPQGHFSKVSAEQEKELAEYYRASLQAGNEKSFNVSEVTRVTREDLTIDFETLNHQNLHLYRKNAERNLKDLYYFTSNTRL